MSSARFPSEIIVDVRGVLKLSAVFHTVWGSQNRIFSFGSASIFNPHPFSNLKEKDEEKLSKQSGVSS